MNYRIHHKIVITLAFVFLNLIQGYSQENNLHYLIEVNSSLSSNKTLPFWMVSNKFGAVPNNNNLLIKTAFYSDFEKPESAFDFSYKASLTGYTSYESHVYVDELYGSFRYKKLLLDIGVKNNDILWEGLSSSNGNIVMSNNARSFPGYNLQLIDYTQLPFAKKWLSVKGNYSDYLLNDPRIIDNTRLHYKSLFFKTKMSSKLEVITGVSHYAQWGGTSSITGKQPSSFSDYLRVVSGNSGGSDALEGDQVNVLGNHIGNYLFQLNYKGDKTNWNFYYSHPFEDRSGREMQNWRDGLYGLFIDLKQPKTIITHLLAEFTYTKHMSGSSKHYTDENGEPVKARGRDNYFNNGVYISGWTYFGNTIGSPYFTTTSIDENGITQGVIQGDNRFKAFNVGIKGYFYNTPYKAMLSHTTYYGWFDNEYNPKPTQLSGVLEVIMATQKKFPFEITLGAAFDTGTYNPVNFGGFLKLTKRGRF